jgi:hypothetical protein
VVDLKAIAMESIAVALCITGGFVRTGEHDAAAIHGQR